MQFVLLHSPLVGPSTWRWVADALLAAGQDVAVPDLRSAAVVGYPEAVIASAVAAVPRGWSAPVLVAHSGAGSILPSAAESLGGIRRKLIFVDAGLPPCEGRVTPSADFLNHLRTIAVDGVLPRWSTWWDEGVMQVLVPSDEQRVELESEMVEVPLAYFESSLPVPEGWCETPGSFVLLSESYRSDAERARALGWSTVERLGGHLDIVNDPDGIARTVLELASLTA